MTESEEKQTVYNDHLALYTQDSLFRQIFQNHAAIFLLVDPATGRILDANRSALDFYGYTPVEIQKLTVPDINALPAPEAVAIMHRVADGDRTHFKTIHRLKNGEIRQVKVFPSLIEYRGRKVLAPLIHDITEQTLVEQKLEEERLQLREAQRLAHLGNWYLDIPNNSLSWSDETCAIFGVTPGTPLSLELFINRIHPEDRTTVLQAWNSALSGATYDIQHRIVVHDQVKWVHERARLIRDKTGRPLQGIGTVHDITEIKQYQQQLGKARDDAEAASRAKSQFLANMSHEIRTPLNGVLGMAQLLHETRPTSEQQEYLNYLQQSGNNLLALLNDILDLSRIEAGKMELEHAVFSLPLCIDEVVAVLTSQINLKQLQLVTNLSHDLPALLIGDSLRVKQILLNLLGNAVKFTESGGVTVTVTVQERTHTTITLLIEVRDTGFGMTPATLERIFEAFEQADNSNTRKYGGSGLGLAICCRLTEVMGGKIWAESELGRGSHFFVSLSFRIAPSITADEHPPVSTYTQSPNNRLRVLIAEDNQLNADTLTAMLKKLGHTSHLAHNGREAIEMWHASAYRCILMDISMPVMDGRVAVAAIREQEQKMGGHTPIIALTAHAMHGDRERFLAEGFDGYLAKPVMMQELQELLITLTRHKPSNPCTFPA